MIKKINILIYLNGFILQRYPEIITLFMSDISRQIEQRAKLMSLNVLDEVGVNYCVEKIDIKPVFLQKEISVYVNGDINPILLQIIKQFILKVMRQMYPFLTTFDITKHPNHTYLQSLNKNTKSVLNK